MEGIFTISPLGRVISNTGKAKGESSPLLHPPSPAESLLRAECFYVQVGGKESVRASEGNALILTLNLLQFPLSPTPPTYGWDPRMWPRQGPCLALWYCAWCFTLNSLPCAWEPREASGSKGTAPAPSSNLPSHLME